MCCFVHVVHRDAQRWHSPTSGRTWCIAVRHRSPLPILYYPSSPAAVTVSDSHLRIVVVFLFSLSAPPFATRINFALASICPPNDGARSLSHASCSPYSSQFLTSLLLQHAPTRYYAPVLPDSGSASLGSKSQSVPGASQPCTSSAEWRATDRTNRGCGASGAVRRSWILFTRGRTLQSCHSTTPPAPATRPGHAGPPSWW